MNNKICFSFVQRSIGILFFVSIIFSTASCCYQPKKNIYNELKLMSFNIRYGTAEDGENHWQNRKEIAFNVIRDYNADLIGLQETLEFQITEIVEAIPQYSYIGVGRDDGKRAGEFCSILYAKDRFIVDSTETFWFSETPAVPGSKNWSNNITRICTWAKLFDKFSGKSLYIFNVHLDHESQQSRVKSVELLLKKISALQKNIPIILTGDFNCGEDNETIQTILKSGFEDTYRSLHSKQQDEGTFNFFKGETSGERIDFIFISKKYSQRNGFLEVKQSEIVKSNFNGKYPSDHFPVTATIKFSE